MKRKTIWKLLPVCVVAATAAVSGGYAVAAQSSGSAATPSQRCWAPAPAAHTSTKPQAAPQFADPVSYALPSTANDFAITHADLNGDGLQDAIVTGGGSNTISVFMARKDGTFAPRVDYQMTPVPYIFNFNVTTADFNGNGRPDIVVSGGNPVGYVAIFKNNGDGTFNPTPQIVSVGYGPDTVSVADLRHDGRLDIITGNNFAADVSVRLNNGNGTFGPERHYPIGPGPQGLVVADVNGDGIPDIITGNFGRIEDSLSVLIGKGNGTFYPARDYAAGDSINDVAVGDLTGNGVQSVVTADLVNQQADVLLGNRCGQGLLPAKHYAIAPGVNRMQLADVTNDGKLDIITSVAPATNRNPAAPPPPPGTKGSGFSVLMGNGDGTFGAPVTFSTTGEVADVSPVDITGNGEQDVIAVNEGTDSLQVWRNLG
ncbi:MAG TPA: VCBS repeat-containing protein [Pseudonocardiaceae bacterium]|jgi:hypothetical protein|nr:VCBS repeat-containing protein [Pseudonocardiaceae bacterium]